MTAGVIRGLFGERGEAADEGEAEDEAFLVSPPAMLARAQPTSANKAGHIDRLRGWRVRERRASYESSGVVAQVRALKALSSREQTSASSTRHCDRLGSCQSRDGRRRSRAARHCIRTVYTKVGSTTGGPWLSGGGWRQIARPEQDFWAPHADQTLDRVSRYDPPPHSRGRDVRGHE